MKNVLKLVNQENLKRFEKLHFVLINPLTPYAHIFNLVSNSLVSPT